MSPDLLCMLDMDGVVLEVNAAWERELGLSRDALVGRPLRSLVRSWDRDELDAHLGNLRFGAARASMDVRILDSEGRERWLSLRLVSDVVEPGIYGSARDITHRRVLYEVVRRVLTSTSPTALAEVVLSHAQAMMPGSWTSLAFFDDSGGVHVHEPLGEGLMVREVTGLEFGDFGELLEGRARLVPDLRSLPTMSPFLEEQAADGMRSYLRLPLVAAAGSLGALHFGSERPAAYGQADVVLGMELARQVGLALAQIGLKQRLAESEAAFRGIAANADGLVVVDESGTVRFTNRAAEELFGVDWGGLDGEVLGLPRVDGERRTVRAHDLMDSAPTGLVAEVRVAETRWAGGLAWLASLRDITEQRQLEGRLSQAQKMGVVGRLAGGVSHDFNNLLTAMLGNVDLLQDELGPDHPGAESLDAIAVAVDRAAGVARQLLAFSRKQVVDPRVVDINRRLERFERVLRSLCGEDVALVFELLDEPLLVRLDPIQLEQVLMNLVVNARDAIEERGTVRVSTRIRVVPAGMETPPPGRYVELAVEDDGVGMSPAVQERIFEPFFTTKAVGQGLGLGLSTVHDIVARSAGHLIVDSKPGRGTRMEVLFSAEEAADHPQAAVSTFTIETLGPTGAAVLVVDDEAPVRDVVAQGLRAAGYEVVVAAGPLEALRRVDDGFLPDLLLTDVRMPDMSGVELESELRARCEGVLVLFMSGYSEEILAPSGVLEEGIEFLGKPFRLTHLLKRVQSMLDDAPG